MKAEAKKIELLWRYANKDCTAVEQQRITEWLSSDEHLRAEWENIQQLNQQLKQQVSTDEPSLRFKANVLEQVATTTQAEGLISRRLKTGLIVGFAFLSLLAALGPNTLSILQLWPEDWPAGWEVSMTNWANYLFDLQLGAHWVVFAAMLMPLLLDQYLLKLLSKHRQKLQQKKN